MDLRRTIRWRSSLPLSAILLFSALPTPVSGEEVALQASDMVITATRFSQELADSPAGTSVITRADIERQPAAQDLGDILRYTPGISPAGQGREGRSTLSVRGLEDKHTLILVDGRRVPNTDATSAHSDFRAQPVPLAAIQRIEIIRGPMSALYGSDALGGVINIITRDPDSDPGGQVNARAGTVETSGGDDFLGSAAVSGSLPDGTGGTAALEAGSRDAVPDRDNRDIDEIESRDRVLGFARGDLPIGEHHQLSLALRSGEDDRASTSDTGEREETIELNEAAFGWQSRLDNATVEFDAYHTETKVRYPGDAERSARELTDQVADGRAMLPWGQRQTFTLGTEFRHERFDSDNMASSDTAQHRRGYIQNVSDLFNDRVTLTLGGSLLDHSRFGSEFSPRANATWRVDDYWRLKGAYGQAFAVPQIRETSEDFESIGSTPGRGFDIVGNPELGPETSEGFELGVTREGYRASVGLTLFRNNVDDLIVTECIEGCMGPPAGQTRQYVNVDRTRTEGTESFLRAEPTEHLRTTLTHTWQRARDRDSDERLPGRPEHRLSLQSGYDLTNQTTFDLDLDYVGRQSQFTGGGPSSEEQRLPSYTLVGTRLSHNPTPALELSAGVENLTDVRLADRDEAFDYHERGRFYFVNLDYRFGGRVQ